MHKLGRDIFRAAAIDLAGKTLLWVGSALLGLVVLLVVIGGSVPAWALVVAVLALAAIAALVNRKTHADLAAIKQELGDLEDELARHTEYSTHLRNALDSLQRVISGDIPAELPYYVDQAVLAPARDLLMARPAENVRLSVLWPDEDDRERWTMAWSAGHTMAGRLKYHQPIAETLARHAFESGDAQYWPAVETQTDFRQNPLASAPTRSMVSMPICRGDEVLAVFNAVSAETDAFDEVEQTFLESLAGVIAVAVSVWFEQAQATAGASGRGAG